MGAAIGFVGADGKGRTVSTVDPLPVDIGTSIDVSIDNTSIEISNDIGNPVPVTPNVQQGSGAVTPTTQRVTLATDGPGVLSLSSIDTKTPALQSGAVPVGDNNSSLTVDGRCYRSTATITRPANQTPYGAGDVIGDTNGSAIITLANVGPSGGFIQIQSIRLLIHSGTLPTGMTGLRLHLYSASPTAIADNAVWDLVSGDRAAYMDAIDFPTPVDYGSTLFTKVDFPGSLLRLASGSTSLFGLLQTTTAATFVENSTVLDLRVNSIEMGL